MAKELLRKVYFSPSDLPKSNGEYTTNFGLLPFKDGKFWIFMGKKYYPTVIEWWLEPVTK